MISGTIPSFVRHVFLTVDDTNGSLLSVTTGMLVSDGWQAVGAYTHLDEAIALAIPRQHHLVYEALIHWSEVHCSNESSLWWHFSF